MRPRGPPRTSAPTNAAHHMTRNAAHSRHAQNRAHHVARRAVYMVGADVPGRPPPVRTGTTPVDDASTRAAEDVGPYQHRTSHDTQRRALTARAGPRISCGAQGRIHGRGGRPRPPAPRTGTTPENDASTRAAGDVGPYQRRTAVACRTARTMWRAGPYACGRGGRPRPPAPRTGTMPVDDASARAAEDVGPYQRRTSHDTQRRALTARAEPRAPCGAQGRIHGRGGRPRPPAPRTGTTPVDDASARAAGDVGPYQHRTAVVCRAAHTSCGAQDDDAHDTLTDAGSLRPSDD